MKRFENKVVWITGASSGIGEATAYQFAQEGAKLILSARRIDELKRVKKQTKLDESQVFILPIDVENIDEIPKKAQEAVAHFGRIDVLFNNAGISQRGSVLETDMAVYQKIMNLNFFGVIALTKAVLPTMQLQKSGQIAITSSLSGKLATPMRSGYCASKHALHGFFDALRSEVYQDNIGVTLICPGYIRTNISLNAVSADGSKFGKMDDNQANGMLPEECAKRIVDAIAKNKQEVYMGGKEVLGVYLKRFFPKLLSKIVRGQMPK
ncbi:Putative oxidoreductase SadH [Emticicia aquatica]|jgi:short-subunit dehydrogenase|uniref:Oxidoreductase SadH n=1 Tax=Emticicia aquatica TaxID=1681835 RepID=A0ABN8ESQ9_9BACT|nr:SDR family oxidoreductase [Emticicia aquatica]CAH0996010.1 Putative oxidoreductase SadH [Emticicia aquatica]